jgi:hypothetical protein
LVKNFRPNLQLASITALRRKRGVFGRDGDVIVDGIGVVGRTQKIAQLHIQLFQKKQTWEETQSEFEQQGYLSYKNHWIMYSK